MDSQQKPILGIIGGSGIYDLDSLQGPNWVEVDTPFGKPSDKILHGCINGKIFAFLPRHGRGHVHTPTGINYKANIWAMKSLGVRRILSVSAVGSLKEQHVPGDFVLVNQFIDRTRSRASTFFDKGMVGHVSMAYPVCASLNRLVSDAADRVNVIVKSGGTYLAMEGPQFSTKAESMLYKQWGCDVIGMTNMPEAKLAREAALCYSSLAMVTDYDCWHPDHENVSVDQVIKTLQANSEKSKTLVEAISQLEFDRIKDRKNCACASANSMALITATDYQSSYLRNQLSLILDE